MDVNIYFAQNLYRHHFGFLYQTCSQFGNVSLARFEKLFFFLFLIYVSD